MTSKQGMEGAMGRKEERAERTLRNKIAFAEEQIERFTRRRDELKEELRIMLEEKENDDGQSRASAAQDAPDLFV